MSKINSSDDISSAKIPDYIVIENFCAETHLSYVMNAGRNTQEFATGKEIIFWSDVALTNWSQEKDGSMIVAVNQNLEVVGFLFATFSKGGIATLENIHVGENFRRQSIASKLLDEFERRATKVGMKILRSFCHTTNTAMLNLLAQHHYSEGVLTQWYVIQPEFINSEFPKAEIQTKQVRAKDINEVQYAEFLSILISDMNYRNTPCLDSAQIIHGAFFGKSLVGLITASVHEPTSKATIERIFVTQSKETSAIIESLILSMTKCLSIQSISCVTIHPLIKKDTSLDLITSLDVLGFKKRRAFIMNTKLTETTNA